jgi:hypothetical protein
MSGTMTGFEEQKFVSDRLLAERRRTLRGRRCKAQQALFSPTSWPLRDRAAVTGATEQVLDQGPARELLRVQRDLASVDGDVESTHAAIVSVPQTAPARSYAP